MHHCASSLDDPLRCYERSCLIASARFSLARSGLSVNLSIGDFGYRTKCAYLAQTPRIIVPSEFCEIEALVQDIRTGKALLRVSAYPCGVEYYLRD